MTGDGYRVLLDTLTAETEDHDHRPDPWESSMQATCECLSWHGVLDNLERRHAEDELGETTYREFPVRTRSVIVTAHRLMDSGSFTADELRDRMTRIKERLER